MNSSKATSRAANPSSSTPKSSSQSVPPTQEYSFTALKNVASEKISSLLQGILGLPSSFNASPNTAHWAVFDEHPTTQSKESTTEAIEALHRSKSHEDTTHATSQEAPTPSKSND